MIDDSTAATSQVSSTTQNEFKPYDLSCDRLDSTITLGWDASLDVDDFEVYITLDDPECCENGVPNALPPISTRKNWVTIKRAYECFSWYVVALNPKDESPVKSDKKCSCHAPPPPCDSCEILIPQFEVLDIVEGCEYVFQGGNDGIECPSQVIEYTIYDDKGRKLDNLFGPHQRHRFYEDGFYQVCMKLYALDTKGEVACEREVCREVLVDDCERNLCSLNPDIKMKKGDADYYYFKAIIPGGIPSNALLVWKITNIQSGYSTKKLGWEEIKLSRNRAKGVYQVCLTIIRNEGKDDECRETICKKYLLGGG